MAFQVILLLSLFVIERAHDRDREADRTSKEVIASGYRLLALLVDGQTGMRGYALTGNPVFTEPYDRAIVQFPAELERLRALAALTPGTSDDLHITELEKLARPVLAFLRSSIEGLRAGHRDARKIPIVVVTSSAEERDRVESYNLGVNSYVVKPIEFDSFTKTISDLGFYWMAINKSAP